MSLEGHPRQKVFRSLVGEQTIIESGFNWWEPSTNLCMNGRVCTLYISYLEDRKLNLVVAEDTRKQSDGRHKDWYFGTFNGTYLDENPEYSEKEYTDILKSIISRKHRVAGRDLEKLISQAI